MHVHYIQHVPFEGPGAISGWAERAGATVTGTKVYAGDSLPDPAETDLLVVLGGPMSVNDEAAYPWLRTEKEFLRHAVGGGHAVVGICLGAQLLASAMGARVYPNREKEIGWLPVSGVREIGRSVLRLPQTFEAFHWHGETFDLPAGAVPLARSTACERQAFQLGEWVIGMQFHLETTPDSARALVDHCAGDLVPAPYVQSKEQILGADERRYQPIHGLLNDVLEYVLRDERGLGV